MELDKKYDALLKDIEKYTNEDVVIAFSGGVDSSLLLKLATVSAKKNGTKVYAVTINTKLHPMNDLQIATSVAKEMGAIHKVIQVDELAEANIDNNPVDRCYKCKKHLFSELLELCKEYNAKYLIDGTNVDDLQQYRPGIKALKELGVISPLAENQFTKSDVRKYAGIYDISVSNRPSAPCLATRLPYNTKICYEQMNKIDIAENFIRDKGFYNVRVRVHDNIARIEIDKNDFTNFTNFIDEIIFEIKGLGYSYVTLDLEGFRSGSMDINIEK